MPKYEKSVRGQLISLTLSPGRTTVTLSLDTGKTGNEHYYLHALQDADNCGTGKVTWDGSPVSLQELVENVVAHAPVYCRFYPETQKYGASDRAEFFTQEPKPDA